jgi:tRNA-dihydrouridine synthase B
LNRESTRAADIADDARGSASLAAVDAARRMGIIPPLPQNSQSIVRIGGYALPNNLAVAPMAGVTDRPFRMLCKRMGAGYAVSEMVASNPKLFDTGKSRRRIDHAGEAAPIAVQIAGADPAMMADAARYNVDRGAEIIDINMGCPAKKVCNAAAGSALLADEALVARILDAVVQSVPVPVTLKIRTGPAPHSRNAVTIARIAERAGIAALAVHGRTRACLFVGPVEFATVRAVKRAVRIPVFANGDIATPQRARDVLSCTAVDGLMIGRAAQGRPWIFREIVHYLETGRLLPPPSVAEARAVILEHLDDHYAFYGEELGVRVARKHLHWYSASLPGASALREQVNRAESVCAQRRSVDQFFARLADASERLPYAANDARHERPASIRAARGVALEAEALAA